MARVIKELGTNRQIYTAEVNVGASGDYTLVAAQENKQICVVSTLLLANADGVKVQFKSGSANITGQMNLSKAGNGFFLPPVSAGEILFPHFVTDESTALVLHVSSGVRVDGFLNYFAE